MNPNARQNVALYTRLVPDDEYSVMQLDDLRRYAGKQSLQYREYVDVATDAHSPQLKALRRDAQKGIVDSVLVWKLDHLFRSLKNLIGVLNEFGSLGIEFVSYNDGLHLTPEQGPTIFHFVAALAEFERGRVKGKRRSRDCYGRGLQTPLLPFDTTCSDGDAAPRVSHE